MKIEPVLTAKEWASKAFEDEALRQALAGLALYGQPFGFSREDVKMLRDAAGLLEGNFGTSYLRDDINELADRIEALLPPRN